MRNRVAGPEANHEEPCDFVQDSCPFWGQFEAMNGLQKKKKKYWISFLEVSFCLGMKDGIEGEYKAPVLDMAESKILLGDTRPSF